MASNLPKIDEAFLRKMRKVGVEHEKTATNYGHGISFPPASVKKAPATPEPQ